MGVEGICTRDGRPPFSVKPVSLVVQTTLKLMGQNPLLWFPSQGALTHNWLPITQHLKDTSLKSLRKRNEEAVECSGYFTLKAK